MAGWDFDSVSFVSHVPALRCNVPAHSLNGLSEPDPVSSQKTRLETLIRSAKLMQGTETG